jgi:hypothetical protein
MRIMICVAVLLLTTAAFAQEAPVLTPTKADVDKLQQQVENLTKLVQQVTQQNTVLLSAANPKQQTENATRAYQTEMMRLADFCPTISTFVVTGTLDGKVVSMCGATIERKRKRKLGIF